jgi:predicted CopG family antitoxin
MTKTARGITIDDEVWNQIKTEAKKENRPISNYVETVLIKHLKEIEKQKTPAD